MSAYLQTGQIACHDARGRRIDCTGSGQEADFKSGLSWPAPRFEVLEDAVLDRLTKLVWTRNANIAEFPLAWQEALDFIATMNRDRVFGFPDWRLPNRREHRSLMSHLFEPDWAWALYLTKGAVGVGQKKGAHFSVWTVCDLPLSWRQGRPGRPQRSLNLGLF